MSAKLKYQVSASVLFPKCGVLQHHNGISTNVNLALVTSTYFSKCCQLSNCKGLQVLHHALELTNELAPSFEWNLKQK